MDLHEHVMQAASRGQLVVQPRLGVPDPREMASRLGALARMRIPVVGTLTVDSYTRVGDLESAKEAWQRGEALNGFPLVTHPPEVVQWVLSHADNMPIQIRHGSADPRTVLKAAQINGVSASEGGPVSYCLPYSRMTLNRAVEYWREGVTDFAEPTRADERPHLETFGGCMLGQLCPPSLLVALSVLEARFFEQCGVTSVSLSYAEQGHWGQDVAALQVLRSLASEFLRPQTARHLVQYTYMGVYPRSTRGALALAAESARKAKAGGAQRLLVKTVAEAHRLPTLSENLSALEHSSAAANHVHSEASIGDHGIADEARAIVESVLEIHDDVGSALITAFSRGVLDVPFCLHPDNHRQATAAVTKDGRIVWSNPGAMPIRRAVATPNLTSDGLLSALFRVASRFDGQSARHRLAFVGCGPRNLATLERLATRARVFASEMPELELAVIDPYTHGAGRIWRTDQPRELLMNTVCGEVTMFSGPQVADFDEPGSGRSLAQWWQQEHPETYSGVNGYAPRALYGEYLRHVFRVCVSSLERKFSIRQYHSPVVTVDNSEGCWQLHLLDGQVLEADTVVCATGHPQARPVDNPRDLGACKDSTQEGDSAADLPLDHIRPGQRVGLIGLGLSFYDLLARFTIGRGGQFELDGDGRLSYLRSGQEPLLWAFSRSGMPIPARGVNQKPALAPPLRPLVFTAANLAGASLRDCVRILEAEVVAAHAVHGLSDAAGFTAAVRALEKAASPDLVKVLAREHGHQAPLLDSLVSIARPHSGRVFPDEGAWEAELSNRLTEDLRHARLGNVEGPVKGALDLVRDLRSTLRLFIEHGGLCAAERAEFDRVWAPVISLLTAGPPVQRVEELLALVKCGVVHVCPPETWVEPRLPGFALVAETVSGYEVQVDHIIDARLSKAAWSRDAPDLIGHLMAKGFVRRWSLTDPSGNYSPGGVDVDAHLRAINAHGQVDPSLFVTGIPTEGKRWFTQVGSGRPGAWTDFSRQADSTAKSLIERAFVVRCTERVPGGVLT